ncbi:MAG: hypothetical protein Q8R28_22760, partial [Dehalococcoidia bacterium]|nr:hypothetical protein [Dehalococcoidia bacterium]
VLTAMADVVNDNDFWEALGKKWQGKTGPIFRKLVVEGATAAASTGVIVDFDRIHIQALQAVTSLSPIIWSQMEATTREAIRGALASWMTGGQGKRGLPSLIASLSPLFSRVRATRIATTEATRFFAEGNRLAVEGDDQVGGLQWQTAEDEKVCPICAPRDMQIYPKAEAPMPPAHVNCLLPGGDIEARGIEAVMRSRYAGPALELRTQSGHKLSVTPNHPILTPRGFRPAYLIQVGDEIICGTLRQGEPAPIDPYHQHGPARIEDIWDAYQIAPAVSAGRVPATTEDLHGDGRWIDGQIDIIGTDGLLENRGQPQGGQHISEGEFDRGGTHQRPLMGSRPLQQFGQRTPGATDGSMSRTRQRKAFLGGQASHTKGIGLRDT